MSILPRIFTVLFLFLSQTIFACPIHESNQKIFSEIIESYFENDRDPSSLFSNIDEIGKEALQKGLDLSCYTYKIDPQTKELFYSAYPLWEGKARANMTFLLYIWPPQQEALQHCANSKGYKTVIHSHPIPCAYTVMQNEITECRYSFINANDRSVELREKEVSHLGDKSVDLTQNPTLFIHQLLFEGKDKKPSITLHVYGGSTVEELSRIFNENTAYLYSD